MIDVGEGAMAAGVAVTERQYQGRVHEESRALMSAWMAELGRAEAERRPTACRRAPS